jgi:hypothetical protein
VTVQRGSTSLLHTEELKVSLLIAISMQCPQKFADTLAEQSLITTDSGQTSGPNRYKFGCTFLLESSGQPHQIVSLSYNNVKQKSLSLVFHNGNPITQK